MERHTVRKHCWRLVWFVCAKFVIMFFFVCNFVRPPSTPPTPMAAPPSVKCLLIGGTKVWQVGTTAASQWCWSLHGQMCHQENQPWRKQAAVGMNCTIRCGKKQFLISCDSPQLLQREVQNGHMVKIFYSCLWKSAFALSKPQVESKLTLLWSCLTRSSWELQWNSWRIISVSSHFNNPVFLDFYLLRKSSTS